VLAAVAILAVVVGGLIATGAQAAQVIGGEGRARFGEPVEFTADGGRRYDIVYVTADIRITTEIDRIIGAVVCEITAADGTMRSVRGDRQAVRSETSAGVSIGWFDVPAGPTTVTCDLTRGGGGIVSSYAVAASRATLTNVAWGIIIGGVIAGLVAAALITVGLRGRAVRVTRNADGSLPDASQAN
jgi:hypothetical protein